MTEKKIYAGRTIKCPSCNQEVRYAWLSGMSGPHVHFYANDNNDVLLRNGWFVQLKAKIDQDAPDPIVLGEIDSLLASLPPSSSNKYSVWNNVKCPICKNEFPYRFKDNLKLRLEDTGIILIDGCKLDTDNGVFLVEVKLVD